MESKRIGTFKEFLTEKRQQQINESQVSIEVDWWDECIVEVMQEIEKECKGFIGWDSLLSYCQQKWAILGRPLIHPQIEDNILTQHIKDLIFQFHGDSFYTDWKCVLGWDNQQVHSKGLVIEELASVILEKVREKSKPQGEPDTGNPTGSLSDAEDVTLVPMRPATEEELDDALDDLTLERKNPVKKFLEYIKEGKK